ncbi:MAG: MerR family transcriptional regulator [Candidatus Omnitrophota bacterium]|nr:MerR family transcriptional regulator [Candidatus Omnitrophota bacterium]
MNKKRYNVKEVAEALGVTRQTLYYWFKKDWVKPNRDYRNYPVFTDEDIKKIEKWRNTLRRP